jgi:hypothetical protein
VRLVMDPALILMTDMLTNLAAKIAEKMAFVLPLRAKTMQ